MTAPKPDPCDDCQGSGVLGGRACDNCLGIGVDPIYWHAHILWLCAQLDEANRQLAAEKAR